MKYTNKHNFPDFVVKWLEYDTYDYDENAISATTLMQPARAYALKKQNWEDLEVDVSDMIASRYGTAIHDSVEKVHLPGCKQEERLRKAVKNRIITGKYDILKQIAADQWQLIDVKSTSVWTYIYGSKDEDFKKQLSIYRWLAVQNGYNTIQKAKIWMIFTDWSATKAQNTEGYPKTRLVIKDIELMGDDQTLSYIGRRIDALNKAALQEQKDMPMCTDEELWAQDDVWQVMKEGRKTSMKNCSSEEEAEEWIGSKQDKTGISTHLRKGGVKRCKYCTARKFCTQYQELIKEGRSEQY